MLREEGHKMIPESLTTVQIDKMLMLVEDSLMLKSSIGSYV